MKIKEQPLVSVVIPTYKRPVDLLSRAIQSVLKQSYKNVEVVLVDDNGKDDAKEFRESNRVFLKELINIHKNIQVIYNESNLGGALSRNVGIIAANGEYITFLDDDDVYLCKKIEHQINYMVENNLDMSFTDITIYDENDKIIEKRIRNDIQAFDKNTLFRYHLTKIISATDTFMIKKNFLLAIGCFDDVLVGHEVYLMNKILTYNDAKIGYFQSDDIKLYRTRNECISNGPNKIVGENELYHYRKMHFKELNLNERLFIKCRHRAVIATVYRRQKRYFKAIIFYFLAFCTNPILCIKEKLKLNRYKKV